MEQVQALEELLPTATDLLVMELISGQVFREGVENMVVVVSAKKALGLGVGAGFLGGAALGAAGTVASMGVYHRYMQYRLLTGGLGYGGYYNNYYYGNNCFGGCPAFAHCEWGFCECN